MISAVRVLFFLQLILIQNSVICKQLIMKKFATCDNGVDYPSKIFSTFYTKNGTQYGSGNATFSQDFGDNIMVNFKLLIFSSITKQYEKVYEAKDKFCGLIKMYSGPFIEDLEKWAQILPGACPIPKGKYQVSDFPLNTDKLTIKNLAPSGKVKIICDNIEIKTGKELLCYEVDIEIS